MFLFVGRVDRQRRPRRHHWRRIGGWLGRSPRGLVALRDSLRRRVLLCRVQPVGRRRRSVAKFGKDLGSLLVPD